MPQPVPEWLHKYIQEYRDLFALGGAEWHIYVKMTDKPAGKESNAGSAKTDFRYLNANLEFVDTIEEGDSARETVVHELGHVSHSEIDEAVEYALINLDDDRQAHFRELYDDALERFLQRLARSIVTNLRPRDGNPTE